MFQLKEQVMVLFQIKQANSHIKVIENRSEVIVFSCIGYDIEKIRLVF